MVSLHNNRTLTNTTGNQNYLTSFHNVVAGSPFGTNAKKLQKCMDVLSA